MAYQKRDVNNNPITPDPYEKRDIDNVNIGALIDENSYERSVLAGGQADTEQPGDSVVTYLSNSWRNWNADYVKRNINNVAV